MYWIDPSDLANGKSDYHLFYVETEADIDNLPTTTKEGVYQDNGDTVSPKITGAGSRALCGETGELYTLHKSTDTWEKLGG